ncbi:MAG: carboxypeptidase-like regulatory domain-containing protein [Terracidiphilus sp.]
MAALLVGVGAAQSVVAQAAASGASGAIAGKLTDLHSMPVNGAVVVLRNQATGAEARATTQKNGIYSFTGLDSGTYTVEAESEQLGRGRLEGIFVAAGHETRVQTAMHFELSPSEPIQAVIHEIAPVTPAVNTPLAAQPLQQPAASERRLPARVQQKPVAAAQAKAGTAQTPPRGEVQAVSPKAGLAASQALATVKPKAAGATLIPGIPEQHGISQAWAAGRGLAIDEAVDGVMQVALRLRKPPPRPMQVAQKKAEPVTPVVTTTLSGAELQALPASGRRWQDFVLDTPAAAIAAEGRAQATLRGAGQSPAETSIDGASIRLAFGGQGGYGPGSSGPGSNGQGGREQNGMGQAWSGGRGAQVAEAAIREVETAAGNAEAEGLRTAGGRMNVETQGGGNGLHGQGFFFDRQNNWGARNPFTQWITETSEFAPFAPVVANALFPVFDNYSYQSESLGSPESYTPPDHETVWGIGLGSQIRRNKLFWFAALDSYHRNDPGVAMVKHPYLVTYPNPKTCPPGLSQCPETTGFFSQPTNDELQVLCARLGLTEPGQTEACTNPLVQALVPYSQMLETLAGLLGPAPRTAKQWVGFGRIDWQAAERHHFTLEDIGARWNSPGGGLTSLSENYGNHSFGNSRASEEWLLGRWEAFITPNLLAVTQGSAGREILETRPSTPSAYEQTLLGPNVYGQLPEIVVDNRYGFTIGNPSRFGQGSYPDERLYQAQESVDWVRGNLLVKTGFEVIHNFDATSLLRNQTGTYTYSNVENFASDALVFQNPQLSPYPLDPFNQHNCDQTGRVWRDSGGGLRGLGALPCYSYYSQTIGPSDWHLSTNDWAGFVTTQWKPNKRFVLSAGLRWEREQLPPPIALLANSQLSQTEKLLSLGNDWGPRVSLAVGNAEGHWPVLRLGYGMYYGRTENATVETALTQTGSPNGDQNFFMRPTDDLPNNGGGAPPFPYVLRPPGPASAIKPGAVEFAPNFRNPEVHQAVVAVEETLPGHVEVTAAAMVSLGRRLPISIDTNLDSPTAQQIITYDVVDGTSKGPIKATRITVPFYASWPLTTEYTVYCPAQTGQGTVQYTVQYKGWLNPCYQQIDQITSKANSTYEAAMLKVTRYGRRGLSLHAHYTYSHAMDWNPNESTLAAGSDVLDPANFSLEYGTSNLDVRHSAAAMVVYEAPWKLRNLAGKLGNGWMVSGIGQFRSGLPYTMRVSGSLPECVVSTGITLCTPQNQGVSATAGDYIVGLGPGMNGSGGDNRVYWEDSDNLIHTIGRNTYRYPANWKADLRVGKKFDLGQMRQLELLAESFNLFNHQNVTELETTGYYIESGTTSSPPTLNFMTGLKANTTAFGQPLNVNATNFYRERQIQVGVRMRF